jgi:hypothetical protein
MTLSGSYNKQWILINESCEIFLLIPRKVTSNTHLCRRTDNLHNTLGIQRISSPIQFRDSKICQAGDIRITRIGRWCTSYQYATNTSFLPLCLLRQYTFFWSTFRLHNLQQKIFLYAISDACMSQIRLNLRCSTTSFIHSFSSLSHDRSKASSKSSSPHSAI